MAAAVGRCGVGAGSAEIAMVLLGRVTVEVSLPVGVAGMAAAVGRCGVGAGSAEIAMVLPGGVTVELRLPVGVTTAPAPVWVWWSGPVALMPGWALAAGARAIALAAVRATPAVTKTPAVIRARSVTFTANLVEIVVGCGKPSFSRSGLTGKHADLRVISRNRVVDCQELSSGPID